MAHSTCLAFFGASLLASCVEADLPCDAYNPEGYWQSSDPAGATSAEVLVLDALATVPEVTAQSSGGTLAWRCFDSGLFIVAASDGAYSYDVLDSSEVVTSCRVFRELLSRFRADYPGVLDTLRTTGAPPCAARYEGYLRDVAFCAGEPDLDATQVTCSGATRPCADPDVDACLECEGELGYATLGADCAAALAVRSALQTRCPDRIVAYSDGMEGGDFDGVVASVARLLETVPAELDRHELVLAALERMRRELPESLNSRATRTCQAPAGTTLDEAIASLTSEAVVMRELLTAISAP